MQATTSRASGTRPDAVPTSSAIAPGLVLLMAVAAGAMAANNYYNQPLLSEIARAFSVSAGAVGAVAAATQIGYAVGLLLIVPLGDRFERKSVIAWLTAALLIALASAAVAPTFAVLVGASLAIGLSATIVQQVIPFAAALSNDASRGRVVGSVMTGLTIGILLARTVSGTIGQHWGWRAVYGVAALIALGIGALLLSRLPKSAPTTTIGYPQLIGSMLHFLRSEPTLREAAVVGALWFACFGAFWSTLALHVAGPPFHYGAQVAGLFGFVGIVGATASRIAGKVADKRGARSVLAVSIASVFAAFVLLWAAGETLWGIIAGVVLLDFGVFAGQVANQTRVFALAPSARSRVNGIYMTCYYFGGALGSAAGTSAFGLYGWTGVCGLGLVCSAAAYLVHVVAGTKGRS